MAEIIKFRKLKLVKPENENERLKSLLKSAVNSEKVPKDLAAKLLKMIRKK